MFRRIGDALGAIFGAKSSTKRVIDPWGAMIIKGVPSTEQASVSSAR